MLQVDSVEQLNSWEDQNLHVKITGYPNNKHIAEVHEEGYVLKIHNSKSSYQEGRLSEFFLAVINACLNYYRIAYKHNYGMQVLGIGS